jgi:hypothetical protein
MAMSGCVGGGWVRMVAAGEVGEASEAVGERLLFFRMGHVLGLQGQEASVTKLEYFGTYLWYLPINPT